MTKLMNQTIFKSRLEKKKISVFSLSQIMTFFGLSEPAATSLLYSYSQKGFVVRLKRNLYSFPDALPPDTYTANKLYEPSYVSLEFALSYHGIIPETVYSITSVTPKATRRFEVGKKVFVFRRVKKSVFTGYHAERQSGESFLIADPEKAFVDAQYFRLIDGLPPISRFRGKKLDKKKVVKYTVLFNNKKFTRIIKTILK